MILFANISFWSYGFITYNLLHACKLGIKLFINNFSENHVTTSERWDDLYWFNGCL